jgi:hypothetical protein
MAYSPISQYRFDGGERGPAGPEASRAWNAALGLPHESLKPSPPKSIQMGVTTAMVPPPLATMASTALPPAARIFWPGLGGQPVRGRHGGGRKNGGLGHVSPIGRRRRQYEVRANLALEGAFRVVPSCKERSGQPWLRRKAPTGAMSSPLEHHDPGGGGSVRRRDCGRLGHRGPVELGITWAMPSWLSSACLPSTSSSTSGAAALPSSR